MLDLKRVLAPKPKEHEEVELRQLLTPWGEALDAASVLPEHPNPQLARYSWRSLNGWWNCAFDRAIQNPHEFQMTGRQREDAGAPPDLAGLARQVRTALPPTPERFDAQILVPFSPESALSGVNRQLRPDELLWYHRSFETPDLLTDHRVLLHFQAVDHTCACYVNGQLAGMHAGGYLPFSFDITDLLQPESNELLVCVADATECAHQLRGKQRLTRDGIWHTAQSGIWQSVWLETVPFNRIERIETATNAQAGSVYIEAQLHCDDVERMPGTLGVELIDADERIVAHADVPVQGESCAVEFTLAQPHLWHPSDPYLYRILLTFGADVVESYCGIRTVEVRPDGQGVARVFLNGEPLFLKGVLDQGYWPDGLMTAPSDEALAFDIQVAREAGFNMMRKHLKVEQARWYYHCDRLGMLVVQDMVSGGDADAALAQQGRKPGLLKRNRLYDDTQEAHLKALGAQDELYRNEWLVGCQQTVAQLASHPCIIAWSLFNEGWGQFSASEACALVRTLDPTRPIDAASGWHDQGTGDFQSVHNRANDAEVQPDKHAAPGTRAFFISECGGFACRVPEHSAIASPAAHGGSANGTANGAATEGTSLAAWQHTVRELLSKLDALEARGLAGYAFAQISDVEEEENGILTCDRRARKL